MLNARAEHDPARDAGMAIRSGANNDPDGLSGSSYPLEEDSESFALLFILS